MFSSPFVSKFDVLRSESFETKFARATDYEYFRIFRACINNWSRARVVADAEGGEEIVCAQRGELGRRSGTQKTEFPMCGAICYQEENSSPSL